MSAVQLWQLAQQLDALYGTSTRVERLPNLRAREYRQRCRTCPTTFRVAVHETALEDAVDPFVVIRGAFEQLHDERRSHVCYPERVDCETPFVLPHVATMTVMTEDHPMNESPFQRREKAQALVDELLVGARAYVEHPFTDRIATLHCVACRREVNINAEHRGTTTMVRFVWFDCHGEHRYVGIDEDIVRRGGAIGTDRVHDVPRETIKSWLADGRSMIERGTATVTRLERFIASEQRTRR